MSQCACARTNVREFVCVLCVPVLVSVLRLRCRVSFAEVGRPSGLKLDGFPHVRSCRENGKKSEWALTVVVMECSSGSFETLRGAVLRWWCVVFVAGWFGKGAGGRAKARRGERREFFCFFVDSFTSFVWKTIRACRRGVQGAREAHVLLHNPS